MIVCEWSWCFYVHEPWPTYLYILKKKIIYE